MQVRNLSDSSGFQKHPSLPPFRRLSLPIVEGQYSKPTVIRYIRSENKNWTEASA